MDTGGVNPELGLGVYVYGTSSFCASGKLEFTRSDGDFDAYVANADGSALQQVTSNDRNDQYVSVP